MGHPYLAGPYPRAYAHRGWHVGDLAGLENTLVSFTRAVQEGFGYIELDVHATADGVAVVHHDASLDRVTDATGPLLRRTAAELEQVRVRGVEPIPRLREVLETLPDTRFTIELKSGLATDAVLADLEAVDAFDRVCLAGFLDGWLEPARARHGDRVFTSFGQVSAVLMRVRAWRQSLPTTLAAASGRLPALPVRGDLAQLPYALGPVPVLGPGLVEAVHADGRELHVWTVNHPDAMHRMLDLGVDGIISDRPDLLRTVLRERGLWTE